jgi:hypothetical protein
LTRYEVGTLLLDERHQSALVAAVEGDAEWRLVAREFRYRLYVRSPKGAPGRG